MLTHVHIDGSFPNFALRIRQSSMFFTAFMLKTLTEIKNYIDVDDALLNKSSNWIFEHQMEDGCFSLMIKPAYIVTLML